MNASSDKAPVPRKSMLAVRVARSQRRQFQSMLIDGPELLVHKRVDGVAGLGVMHDLVRALAIQDKDPGIELVASQLLGASIVTAALDALRARVDDACHGDLMAAQRRSRVGSILRQPRRKGGRAVDIHIQGKKLLTHCLDSPLAQAMGRSRLAEAKG